MRTETKKQNSFKRPLPVGKLAGAIAVLIVLIVAGDKLLEHGVKQDSLKNLEGESSSQNSAGLENITNQATAEKDKISSPPSSTEIQLTPTPTPEPTVTPTPIIPPAVIKPVATPTPIPKRLRIRDEDDD